MLHKTDADHKEFVLMWVQEDTLVQGNEAADSTPKEALDKEPADDIMPFSDLNPLTAKNTHQVWQKECDEAAKVSNKLREILPKLSDKLL